MSNNHKDLTVLLALKDRAPFTFRWMSYANAIKLPFKVLIADGGKDETVTELLANRANFPDVDYEYVRYPYDETYTDFYAKLVDGIGRVKTPFVVHADDDDFFIVDGLMRSVDFLRDHPDYSSCRGTIAGITVNSDVKYAEFNCVYGKDVSFQRHMYPPGSTLQATAAERVRSQFATYRANWYDVYRTEDSKAIFQVLLDLNTKDLILAQHVPMLLGVAAGKVHRDSYLYLVRQIESPWDSTRAETRKKGDHFDRMLLESWSQDFKSFVDAIAAAVAGKDGIPIDAAREQVKQGYRELMTPGIVSCLLESVPQARSVRITNKLRSYLRPAGSLVRKLQGGDSGGHDFIPAAALSDADKDLKLIYDFVANPPHAIERLHNKQLGNSLAYSSS